METQDTKIQDDIKQSAHRIWLAGLGALAAAEEEGSKLFTRLVERGKDIESEGKEKFEKAKEKTESAFENFSDAIDEKVTAALHRMGVPTRDEIKRLTKKVEALTEKIEQLKPRAEAGEAGEKKAATRRKTEA